MDHYFVGRDGRILVIAAPAELVDVSGETLRRQCAGMLPIDEARAEGEHEGVRALVLDCVSLGLINSMGITTLLQIEELCRRAGVDLVLATVHGQALTLLQQVRLDDRFTMAPSVDAASELLESSGGS